MKLGEKPSIEKGLTAAVGAKEQGGEVIATPVLRIEAGNQVGITSSERIQPPGQVSVKQQPQMDAGINAPGRVETALHTLEEAYHLVYSLVGNLGNDARTVNEFLKALRAKARMSSSNPPVPVTA